MREPMAVLLDELSGGIWPGTIAHPQNRQIWRGKSDHLYADIGEQNGGTARASEFLGSLRCVR